MYSCDAVDVLDLSVMTVHIALLLGTVSVKSIPARVAGGGRSMPPPFVVVPFGLSAVKRVVGTSAVGQYR